MGISTLSPQVITCFSPWTCQNRPAVLAVRCLSSQDLWFIYKATLVQSQRKVMAAIDTMAAVVSGHHGVLTSLCGGSQRTFQNQEPGAG